ncbi:Uncharacterised protein [Segatella copri]|nr:Uncharacterised protein [Segatella copri]
MLPRMIPNPIGTRSSGSKSFLMASQIKSAPTRIMMRFPAEASRSFCIDAVLHLHGFENDNSIACVHLVTDFHLDFVDSARQRGNNWFACSRSCLFA